MPHFNLRFRILAIFGLLLYLSMADGTHHIANAEEEAPQSKCNIHKTVCVTTLPNCIVTLDITPKPVKAMSDLNFVVTLTGKTPSGPPHIDLGMPGMHMGPNQVKLKAVGDQVYQGKGVIVRCPSGRRTWQAAVTIPDIGIAEFVFDVFY